MVSVLASNAVDRGLLGRTKVERSNGRRQRSTAFFRVECCFQKCSLRTSMDILAN
jgi:hypothetical protein